MRLLSSPRIVLATYDTVPIPNGSNVLREHAKVLPENVQCTPVDTVPPHEFRTVEAWRREGVSNVGI